VVVGALSGRRPHPRTEDLIGLFVTTLPIPAAVSAADSFSQLLSQGRTRTLQAFAHQEVPMDRVTVGSSREPSRGSARGGQEPFQMLLIDQSQWQGELRLEGVEAEAHPIRGEKIAAFDLCWTVLPAKEGLRLALEYDSARYRQQTAERLLGYFAALLRDVAAGNARPVGEWPSGWLEVAGGALRQDGKLWLTDGPSPKTTAASADAGPMPGAEDRKVLAAQLKAEADTKKSRLSAQKLALLRQRLKK
jgi:surfactin family lipopeptide synthetase A